VKLAAKDNSFDEANRVRCFNHSIQLAAKALLKPFNAGLGSSEIVINDEVDDGAGGAEQFATAEEDDDEGFDLEDGNLSEHDEDEFEGIAAAEREELLADTTAVRETVTKVRFPLGILLELC